WTYLARSSYCDVSTGYPAAPSTLSDSRLLRRPVFCLKIRFFTQLREKTQNVLPVVDPQGSGFVDVVGRGIQHARARKTHEMAGAVIDKVVSIDQVLLAAEDKVHRRQERQVLHQPFVLCGKGGGVLHGRRGDHKLIVLMQGFDHGNSVIVRRKVGEKTGIIRISANPRQMFRWDTLIDLGTGEISFGELLVEFLVVPLNVAGQCVDDGFVHVDSDTFTHSCSCKMRPAQRAGGNDGSLKVGVHQWAGFCVVVHAVHTETEQLEELLVVAFKVGQLEQVLFGDLRPDFLNTALYFRVQLQLIYPQATGFIQARRTTVQTFREQALNLLNTAFVGATFFHNFEQDGQVQRHDRNGRAGLSDNCLEDGNPCAAVQVGELAIQCPGSAVQIFFRFADSRTTIDRPGELVAEIGV